MTLPFDFDKALQGLSRVTLKGGVVGKVTLAISIVAISCVAIAWSVGNVWVSAGALVAIFTLAFATLWRLIGFADRHPQAALLEGAEFLVHEQIVHATKSAPGLALPASEQTQPEPIDLTPAAAELAQLPDAKQPHLTSGGGDR